MLSVIVPVYNTEKYLKSCLESLVKQTYADLEILLIDDGSTDLSGTICDEFAKEYPQIVVRHQENQGVVVARNKGLEQARGEYISFVDSDDWLDADFFEKAMSYAVDEKADIVAMGAVYEGIGVSRKVVDTVPEGVYSREEIRRNIWNKMAYDQSAYRQGISASLGNKIIKTDILKEVASKIDTRIKYCEDGALVYLLFTKIDKLVVTHYCGYHYVQHEDSAIHTYTIGAFENISILQKCMKKELLGSQEEDVLNQQITGYVAPLLNAAVKSVYGITLRIPVYLFPFHMVPRRSKVILYGAGVVGTSYYRCLESGKYADMVAWVDKNHVSLGEVVESPDVIMQTEFDYIVISVVEESVAESIRKQLLSMGVDEKKILWEKPCRIA